MLHYNVIVFEKTKEDKRERKKDRNSSQLSVVGYISLQGRGRKVREVSEVR